MRFCQKCGAQIADDNLQMCPQCGTMLAQVNQEAQQYSTQQYGEYQQQNQCAQPFNNNQPMRATSTGIPLLALIFGIIGVVMAFIIPIIGIILGIAAVILSNSSKNKINNAMDGKAKAGKILGIIAIVAVIIKIVVEIVICLLVVGVFSAISIAITLL